MLETKQNNPFQFNDDNLQPVIPVKNEFKLPKIIRPASRNHPSLNPTQLKFPNIKIDSSPAITDQLSQPSQASLSMRQNFQGRHAFPIQPSRKATQSENQQQDFVMEVEKKLKMVLQQQNVLDIEESEGESDDDFQRKINQNKEIIKMHKLKKETENQSNQFGNYQTGKQLPLQLPLPYNRNKLLSRKQKGMPGSNPRVRNQSLYEKRAKEYRDSSVENKYLQRKKETIANKILKETTIFKQKQGKSKETLSLNKILPQKIDRFIEKDKERSFQEKEKDRTRQSSSYQYPPQRIRNEELFDNIQGFLQNPRRSENDLTLNPSMNVRKNRKQLQQRLKLLQQRLKQHSLPISLAAEIGSLSFKDKNMSLHPQSQPKIVSNTIHDWKKVQVLSNNLNRVDTNFDKQLQRINHYLQRNEDSIDKYINHQKILVQMNLLKKMKNKGFFEKQKQKPTMMITE